MARSLCRTRRHPATSGRAGRLWPPVNEGQVLDSYEVSPAAGQERGARGDEAAGHADVEALTQQVAANVGGDIGEVQDR